MECRPPENKIHLTLCHHTVCLRIGHLKSAYPVLRNGAADQHFEVCTRLPAAPTCTWLQARSVIPWVTEMYLSSLHLQRDCSMFVPEGVTAWNFMLFVSVTFTITQMTLIYMNLTWDSEDDLHAKMNFLGQDFLNLEHYRRTDRQTHKEMWPNALPGRIREW